MEDVSRPSLLINGEACAAVSGKTFERIDPYTGLVASRAPAGSIEDAKRAADAAAAAFPSWSKLAPTARRAYLLRAADLMAVRADDFGAIVTAETGAVADWGRNNALRAVDILRQAAAMTTQIVGEVLPTDKPDCISMAVPQPVGVCLGIAPWNAPVILGVRAIAMPLACGNTVVLKASEICPATHRMIGQVFVDAGLPRGVVNVMINAQAEAADVVNTLIAHPAVQRINFTGSTRVGRIIALTAAKHLKPCLLELGGKAPFIVLDDADLDLAAEAAAFGAFRNQGQICVSTERLIVDEKVADEFVAKLAVKARAMTVGDPRKEVSMGTLISIEAAQRVEELVTDALAKGATLVAGGTRNGAAMQATLLDHVNANMKIYHEESFGPAKGIIRVRNVDAAVQIANDTEYGLSAAVFGRDTHRAYGVARRLETGICHVNGTTIGDEPQAPFGGLKNSGYGRFGGKASVAEFTELRWITIEGSCATG